MLVTGVQVKYKGRFRWHRGGLEDSMSTMVEDHLEALRDMLTAHHPGESMTSKFYAKDPRIDWEDTYMVLANDIPVGFSDTDLFGES